MTADVRETQKIEGLRLSQPALLSVDRRKAAKFDQARLVRVERQRELLQSFPQCHQESMGIVGSFKADHHIIGVAHDDDVATGVMFAPVVDPEIEDIMEKDVSQQGRNHTTDTKGNFVFERQFALSRLDSVLDMRRKK